MKQKKNKNCIVHYTQMSGCKLALLAPLVDTQIKHAVKEGGFNISLVLCSSQSRLSELREFLQEMVAFAGQAVSLFAIDSKTTSEEVAKRLDGSCLLGRN